jgi:peroxiredoxin (alkyl hydroperoxide reductase subunit C)
MGGVSHPVLSDFNPHGAVAKAYGVFNEANGQPRRAAFVIDKDGVIRFSKEYQGVLPQVDEILAELDKLDGK